jgi:hypothetical protein
VRALLRHGLVAFCNTLKLRQFAVGTKLAMDAQHMMSTSPKLASALLALVGFLALPACAGLGDDSVAGEDSLPLSGDGTNLSLEWVIQRGDTLLSCIDAGATEIEIAVLGETDERQRISCFGGYAVIDGLSEGSAIVEVSLVGPNGDLLMTSDVGEVALRAGVTNPLGAIAFEF